MFDVQQVRNKFVARLFSKSPWLFNQWVDRSSFVEFDDSPWTELTKSVAECKLALITTSGVHLKSHTPFNMNDPCGDPTFREIPADTRFSDLTITHNYYDHRDADKDINIVFPLERIKPLASSGEIGSVNHRHFSFMGHITDSHISTLVIESAPKVADMLKRDEVDIVILTPA